MADGVLANDAKDIFRTGLEAVAPGTAIKNQVSLNNHTCRVGDKDYDLDAYEKILVIGFGKAGATMARAMEDIFGSRISTGLVVVKYGHMDEVARIEIVEAGHPVPDDNGFQAAQRLFEIAEAADEKTLVFCLISGGGSALTPLPVDGISLEDKKITTQVLLDCGATIHEINAVRKHLSRIKGGGLARAVYPATLVSLILSDVVGDNLDSIASGPCVPDNTSFRDCLDIIEKYKIYEKTPASVISYLEQGSREECPETPKEGETFFEKSQNLIVGSNFNALFKARQKALDLGYNTLLLSSMIEGETRDVAGQHIAIAREVHKHQLPVARPACLLSGGETTVTIKGNGKGGRNQEFVLAAAIAMNGIESIAVLCAGTDGNDGPTDAAGAVADETTIERARAKQLDPKIYLDNNDAYHFFDELGDLYKTGPTNTNVMDIRIILLGSE